MTTKWMKKLIAVGCLFMLSTAAVGCANTVDNGAGQQRMQMNGQNGAVKQQQQTGWNNRDADRNADERIEVADRAADQITSISGVRSANVLVTRNNAYVAAVLDDSQRNLSRETEDQIAEKVRQVDPSIQNVYVSTNPDFVNRINTYVADVQEGRPVAGFVEQFNEMVQRVFPNAR